MGFQDNKRSCRSVSTWQWEVLSVLISCRQKGHSSVPRRGRDRAEMHSRHRTWPQERFCGLRFRQRVSNFSKQTLHSSKLMWITLRIPSAPRLSRPGQPGSSAMAAVSLGVLLGSRLKNLKPKKCRGEEEKGDRRNTNPECTAAFLSTCARSCAQGPAGHVMFLNASRVHCCPLVFACAQDEKNSNQQKVAGFAVKLCCN